jgi:acyl-coenzyme A synthetase/AMP-(fatty) acid ligase
MPESDLASLHELVAQPADHGDRHLWGADDSVVLKRLAMGSVLGGHLAELSGRSVLLRTKHQFAAALALIELDGVARRLLLCPPDVKLGHLPTLIGNAEVDAVVIDSESDPAETAGLAVQATCSRTVEPAPPVVRDRRTEWLLMTSGTAGLPKLVMHTLASLTDAIKTRNSHHTDIVWGTFYDIRRYGGLQIFFRALLSGGSLVLSDAGESVQAFLARLGQHGVTHLTGTPSHWRRVLMSPANKLIAPRYVRLSGEIVDSAVLEGLRELYPRAGIGHAFASTEAGVAFDVDDAREGFPADLIGTEGEVTMKVEDGTLRIRSRRTAIRYLTTEDGKLLDADGFVDTGDLVERRDERYYFLGRRGGIVNVGGLKVHPEEVETVINHHPDVRMSLVRGRKNPFTGSVVVADVLLKDQSASARSRELEQEIRRICREALPAHKVPAAIRFVHDLEIAESGKLVRRNA